VPVARDTRTRFQGVFARHREACRVSAGAAPSACNCTPSYYGVVWDGAACKTRKTRRFKRVMEARNTRKDLAASLSEGRPLPSLAGPHLGRCASSSSGRRARASLSQQVGSSLPAALLGGLGVFAQARTGRARAPADR
jgi:hypothetical protein